MAEQFYVRVVNTETGEETVSEVWRRESDAVSYAEQLAEEYYGGDDVTWWEALGNGRYQAGRISENGERSEPLVAITVEAEEVEAEPD